MTDPDFIQGSAEWLEMRRHKIMASDAPIILGVSPWKKPLQLLIEKLSGTESEKKVHMQRGNDLEPEARELFESLTGHFVAPRVLFHPRDEWMGASVDGINDGGILVEIKCPGKKDHETALNHQVPSKYEAQLQHQLYVCGLDYMYYFSYNPSHEKKHAVFMVSRDNDFVLKMIPKLQAFYQILCSARELNN